ncbi:MAG TPA: hypothetical protein VKG25_23235 [Bryobacteraceae bacterium]|nr:hypothetical protein [Bryobacteraceae bacterium]
MAQDTDIDLLRRVTEIDDFCGSVLFKDETQDWNLARDFGSYLVRVRASDLCGHLLLARSYRHLGDPARAAEELALCRSLLDVDESEMERAALTPVVETEERLLAL